MRSWINQLKQCRSNPPLEVYLIWQGATAQNVFLDDPPLQLSLILLYIIVYVSGYTFHVVLTASIHSHNHYHLRFDFSSVPEESIGCSNYRIYIIGVWSLKHLHGCYESLIY